MPIDITRIKPEDLLYKTRECTYRLEDLHQGNEKLFAAIADDFKDALTHRVTCSLGKKDPAYSPQDVVQEAMIRLWENKEKMYSFHAMSGYLFRASHSACMDVYKKKRSKFWMVDVGGVITEHHLQDKDHSLMKRIEDKDQVAQVFAFTAATVLPAQNEAFLRFYQDDMSDLEIAEQLQENPANIKTRRHIALRKVRSETLAFE